MHGIPPVYNEYSHILILGSSPSVKSREGGFFYHHPQNRFWKVIAALFDYPVPVTIEDKKRMLLENNIALWDVIASCDMEGSSDVSIHNVIPNDLELIISHANICQIFANGTKAYALYEKYCYPKLGVKAVGLPSTSPANASFALEKLLQEWKIIKQNK
ncbi:MAG: DNA-deoxyinosine glycosylase [Christensenellales bacterium]